MAKRYLRMHDKPEVYDTQEGMRHISAEEFTARGNPWQEVEVYGAGAPPVSPEVPTDTSPRSTLSNALMAMVKGYQGMDATKLLEAKEKILQEKYKRATAPPPKEGLAPSQIQTIRQAGVSALAPQLQEITSAISRQQQGVAKALDLMGVVRTMIQDRDDHEEKQRSLALEGIANLAQSGVPFESIPIDQIAQYEQAVNLPEGTFQQYYQGQVDIVNKQKKLADLEVSLKQKELAKPYWKPEEKADLYFKDNETDKEYDLATVEGIKQLKTDRPVMTYSDIYAFMDENTKLTTGAIDNLLTEAGIKPTEKQFLTKEYLRSLYTEEQLKEAAKEAGFTSGGFLGFGVGKRGIDDYLNYLIGLIEQYRQAGYSDKEILKQMR